MHSSLWHWHRLYQTAPTSSSTLCTFHNELEMANPAHVPGIIQPCPETAARSDTSQITCASQHLARSTLAQANRDTATCAESDNYQSLVTHSQVHVCEQQMSATATHDERRQKHHMTGRRQDQPKGVCKRSHLIVATRGLCKKRPGGSVYAVSCFGSKRIRIHAKNKSECFGLDNWCVQLVQCTRVIYR